LQEPREAHVQLLRDGVDTMAKVMHFVAKLHQHKRCLGPREILAEEDEIQPNKRVFKKVSF
jgi:long-chain acyl-CoA synthetase